MWTLSGFVDEIDPDFTLQCDVARELGLNFIEFRSAWDVNVLKLSDAQLDQVQEILTDHSLGVSSIGSPIGKIYIDDDFEPHLEQMRRAVQVAHRFRAPYIRIFSFFLRPDTAPEEVRDEVMRRMSALVQIAEEGNVTLLHENEKGIYGDVPARCHDLVTTVDSPRLRIAWDAANYVQVGVNPHTEGFELLRPYLEYVQIKDALHENGKVVPAGEGDGQVRETIRGLRDVKFEGFFSLEPHLESHSSTGGFSGPDLFRTAHKAFTGLLKDEQIPYA